MKRFTLAGACVLLGSVVGACSSGDSSQPDSADLTEASRRDGGVSSSDSSADLVAYRCHAPANPERGFNADFDIVVSPLDDTGTMRLEAGGMNKQLGQIQVARLQKDDAQTGPAFGLLLGLVAATDTSGLADPGLVDSAIQYAIQGDDHEFSVIRLMHGDAQIGGTFLADGLGTRCLPAGAR